MLSRFAFVPAALLLLLIAACGDDPAPPPPQQESQPESVAAPDINQQVAPEPQQQAVQAVDQQAAQQPAPTAQQEQQAEPAAEEPPPPPLIITDAVNFTVEYIGDAKLVHVLQPEPGAPGAVYVLAQRGAAEPEGGWASLADDLIAARDLAPATVIEVPIRSLSHPRPRSCRRSTSWASSTA